MVFVTWQLHLPLLTKETSYAPGWVVTKELSSLKDGEPFNVCVLIRSLDTRHHGTMEVVNLKLGNSISDAIERRIPQATGETLQFDSTARKHTLVPNQVYMLVGAKMRYKDGGESLVRVPGTTESTATILLPTRADAIVGVAELCCGGVCGWSRAARELPAYPVIRVDHDGMSISTALLNEPREILHSDTQDQQRFTVFWGNVMDLRWVAALHDSNVEILCCSPPSHPWSSKSKTLVPTEKPRHFMIFWNSADAPSAGTTFRMLRIGSSPQPCEQCLWRKMPQEILQETEIKLEHMNKVTSRELLPPYQKSLVGSAVHIRMVNPHRPLPMVPTAYHKVLEFPWPSLMKKGMHLPIMEQDHQLRLLSKWEIAKAYGLPGDLILPAPEGDGPGNNPGFGNPGSWLSHRPPTGEPHARGDFVAILGSWCQELQAWMV